MVRLLSIHAVHIWTIWYRSTHFHITHTAEWAGLTAVVWIRVFMLFCGRISVPRRSFQTLILFNSRKVLKGIRMFSALFFTEMFSKIMSFCCRTVTEIRIKHLQWALDSDHIRVSSSDSEHWSPTYTHTCCDDDRYSFLLFFIIILYLFSLFVITNIAIIITIIRIAST